MVRMSIDETYVNKLFVDLFTFLSDGPVHQVQIEVV